MRYRIEYTATSEQELEQAYRWILERSQSPQIASNWFNGITRAIDALDELPKRCGFAPENDYFAEEIRQLLYSQRHGQYRILFTLREETVVILHIRHSAREHLNSER
jgi:plasmid stabilization system protein ParE